MIKYISHNLTFNLKSILIFILTLISIYQIYSIFISEKINFEILHLDSNFYSKFNHKVYSINYSITELCIISFLILFFNYPRDMLFLFHIFDLRKVFFHPLFFTIASSRREKEEYRSRYYFSSWKMCLLV